MTLDSKARSDHREDREQKDRKASPEAMVGKEIAVTEDVVGQEERLDDRETWGTRDGLVTKDWMAGWASKA